MLRSAPYQSIFDDPPCSLLVKAQVFSWLHTTCFRIFDLFEILLDACEFVEDGVLFSLNSIEAKIC